MGLGGGFSEYKLGSRGQLRMTFRKSPGGPRSQTWRMSGSVIVGIRLKSDPWPFKDQLSLGWGT